MTTILLTNDDGIGSTGLHALEKAFAPIGEVWVVAPHIERSAAGRAVTLHRPLRVIEAGEQRFAVDGTPSDCVLLAFRSLLPTPPQVVVSGINQGYNVGEDLDYSGTVGAAAEGALQGARVALAVSTDRHRNGELLAFAASFAKHVAVRLLENPVPAGCYVNINLPAEPTSRFRWTRQGNWLQRGEVKVAKDPRGKTYYWIAERPDEDRPPADTDRGAIKAGIVSLSLLTLNRSHTGAWQPPGLAGEGFVEEK
jgi:5'-nucleotidase